MGRNLTWWAMVPRVAKSPTWLRMHTFPQEPREEGASETASQESSNNPRGVCSPSERKWAKATFSNSKLTALALSAQRSADKCQGSTEAKRKLQNKPSTSYCLCKIWQLQYKWQIEAPLHMTHHIGVSFIHRSKGCRQSLSSREILIPVQGSYRFLDYLLGIKCP